MEWSSPLLKGLEHVGR